jgi:F0F1-type ATP synthase membrane subunit b/b'
MTFDFDLTFVLMMVVFAALIVVLKPLLFEPVLRVFEEREKRTEGARDSARAMQEEAGALLRSSPRCTRWRARSAIASGPRRPNSKPR